MLWQRWLLYLPRGCLLNPVKEHRRERFYFEKGIARKYFLRYCIGDKPVVFLNIAEK